MENAARNVIVAVQNSLLGDLVFQLAMVVATASLVYANVFVGRLDAMPLGIVGLPLVVAAVVIFFGAWLIGHIANRRVRIPASDTAMNWPRSGFDAWRELPDGGLTPSPFMRRLVTAFSAGRKLDLVLFVLLIVVVASGAVCVVRPEWIESRLPGLAIADQQTILYLAWLAVSGPIAVRRWAKDSVSRLSSAEA